jgi:hypothetical protein
MCYRKFLFKHFPFISICTVISNIQNFQRVPCSSYGHLCSYDTVFSWGHCSVQGSYHFRNLSVGLPFSEKNFPTEQGTHGNFMFSVRKRSEFRSEQFRVREKSSEFSSGPFRKRENLKKIPIRSKICQDRPTLFVSPAVIS